MIRPARVTRLVAFCGTANLAGTAFVTKIAATRPAVCVQRFDFIAKVGCIKQLKERLQFCRGDFPCQQSVQKLYGQTERLPVLLSGAAIERDFFRPTQKIPHEAGKDSNAFIH